MNFDFENLQDSRWMLTHGLTDHEPSLHFWVQRPNLNENFPMFEAPKAAFRCSDDTLTEISLDQSSDSKLSTTHCAQDKHSHPENKYRKNRLLIAVCICTLLFILEFAGGMYTNSLAILADSFHMLTEFSGTHSPSSHSTSPLSRKTIHAVTATNGWRW
jgi:Cation efflux family